MNPLSDRVKFLTESATLAMTRLSRELTAQGLDVINLSIGEPDFDTPSFVKEAAKKAIDDNWTHYPPVPGYQDLREAVSQKLKRDNNLDYSPEQIVVSTGAKPNTSLFKNHRSASNIAMSTHIPFLSNSMSVSDTMFNNLSALSGLFKILFMISCPFFFWTYRFALCAFSHVPVLLQCLNR